MEITTEPVKNKNDRLSYLEQFTQISEELTKLGLTPNQSKVYCVLGKMGPMSASEIAKFSRIPRTEIYNVLTKLQEKGIISSTFDHPIKFSAMKIEKATQILFNAEKEKLEKMKNDISNAEERWYEVPSNTDFDSIKEEKFQVLRGTNTIKNKINSMILSTDDEIKIIGCEKDFVKFYYGDIFENIKKSQIKYRVLTSIDDDMLYLLEGLDLSFVKKLPSEVQETLCFFIKDNKEVLFYIKSPSKQNNETISIWSDSDTITYSKSLLFDALWDQSGPYIKK